MFQSTDLFSNVAFCTVQSFSHCPMLQAPSFTSVCTTFLSVRTMNENPVDTPAWYGKGDSSRVSVCVCLWADLLDSLKKRMRAD